MKTEIKLSRITVSLPLYLGRQPRFTKADGAFWCLRVLCMASLWRLFLLTLSLGAEEGFSLECHSF